MPHIRLIAIDLDGTLLTSDRKLSPGALEAVREATEAGVAVCLASGRALNTIVPYAEELGLVGPVVSCNGAFVLGADGAEIHHCTLPEEASRVVLGYGRALGLHTNLYVGGKVYFSHEGHWADLYRARTGVKEEAVLSYVDLGAYKPTKVLFVDGPEAVKRHHAETSKLLGSHLAAITLSEPEYIEYLPPGINKGVGVERVAMALSLQPSQVAALGDYLNDLEMVRWAGLGGAVANAVREVREQADLVVASNDEGGAAEFIRTALRFKPEL
jgi:Cof subfamily protein (haloacid dehalogenase superfamily)